MALEHEAKLRVEDPRRMRQRLRECGARPAGGWLEVDRIFDTADGRLRKADCGLRVRQRCDRLTARPARQNAVLLTFKGPRVGGEVKSREELETPVDDGTVLIAVLERLGFHLAIMYEKRREAYRLGECEIALDELPRLGWWLEIEGPDAGSVERVRARLGLADASLVRETYVEMAATHGDQQAGGTRWLGFDRG